MPFDTETLPPNFDVTGEWAIIELFGHTTLVGRIAEVERFGSKMLALEPLFNGTLLPAIFHGGAAIYRLTPCSAEVAWRRQPQHKYQLPPTIIATLPLELLPAPERAPVWNEADDEDYIEDDPEAVGDDDEEF